MGINKIVLNTDEGERTLIDISDSTVTAAKLMKGQTAYGADGEKIIGTLEPGIDTSSATATADDIIYPMTAYVNGKKVTGALTMERGSTTVVATPQMGFSIGPCLKMTYNPDERRVFSPDEAMLDLVSPFTEFGDATAEDVAKGKTFTSAAGLKMIGTKEDTGSAGGSDNTVFGTWVFVDDPDLDELPNADAVFVSNGSVYKGFAKLSIGSSTWGIWALSYNIADSDGSDYIYTNNPGSSYGIAHGWKDEAFKTITITASPDDEAFATWLRANAVKQEEAVKPEDVVGTWVFVDEPDLSTLPSQTELSFTSNGVDYDTIVHGHPGSATWGIHSLNYASVGGGVIAYADNPGGSYGITHGWKDEAYKTIVIHEEPSSSEFVTWLKANATKQT